MKRIMRRLRALWHRRESRTLERVYGYEAAWPAPRLAVALEAIGSSVENVVRTAAEVGGDVGGAAQQAAVIGGVKVEPGTRP